MFSNPSRSQPTLQHKTPATKKAVRKKLFALMYQGDFSKVRDLAIEENLTSEDFDSVIPLHGYEDDLYKSSFGIATLLSLGWQAKTHGFRFMAGRYSQFQSNLDDILSEIAATDAMLQNRGQRIIVGHFLSHNQEMWYSKQVSFGLHPHIRSVQRILDDVFGIDSVSNEIGQMLWPVDYKRNWKRSRQDDGEPPRQTRRQRAPIGRMHYHDTKGRLKLVLMVYSHHERNHYLSNDSLVLDPFRDTSKWTKRFVR